MIKMLEPMMGEIQQEAATTKRVLERVPGDKLSWKPHSKSMTLGQLAIHVATIPGAIATMAQQEAFDVSKASFEPPQPASTADLLKALDESIKTAETALGGLSESSATGTFRLVYGEKEIFALPRIAMLRSIMLNHWYHHRGQLSVYLRLLDIPVPVIYGRSADENPFQ